jgi:hypothetical protein
VDGGQVVGRPRVAALIGWSLMLTVGAALLLVGSAGALVIGIPWALIALFGLVSTVMIRVWVDGDGVLHSRALFRGGSVRLDRLTDAHRTPFGRNSGPVIELADATGASVRLDATNGRMKPLYPVLARHIPPDARYANAILLKKLARHRPGPPLGSFD